VTGELAAAGTGGEAVAPPLSGPPADGEGAAVTEELE
jgi:hypothetical protein